MPKYDATAQHFVNVSFDTDTGEVTVSIQPQGDLTEFLMDVQRADGATVRLETLDGYAYDAQTGNPLSHGTTAARIAEVEELDAARAWIAEHMPKTYRIEVL